MWLTIAILVPAIAFANAFCVKVERDPYRDPYLGLAVLKTIERAVIESGLAVSCDDSAKDLNVRIVSFREVPIAFTPDQRVSVYNLSLTLKVTAGSRQFTVSGSVPYSLPTGGLGDIPRRKAIDDLLDKLYLNILEKLRGGVKDADKR